MFYAYRGGKKPITAKVWRKFEALEKKDKTDKSEEPKRLVREDESPFFDHVCRMIPVIGWAHAGQAGSYDEIPPDWQQKIPTECPDVKAFGVQLEGDSMEPKFSDGDLLIIQPSHSAYSGCFAVARFTDDAVVLRRLEMTGGVIRLIPLNERYPVTEHQPEEFSWIYPVWGRWTQIWRR